MTNIVLCIDFISTLMSPTGSFVGKSEVVFSSSAPTCRFERGLSTKLVTSRFDIDLVNLEDGPPPSLPAFTRTFLNLSSRVRNVRLR